MYDINFVKKRLIVSMGAVLLLVIVLIGITYAYFVSSVKGNTNDKSIGVSSGKLELTYGDGNGLISADLIQPGIVLNTKTFTVENTGTATVHDYSIIIEDVINELERYEDLTYTLTCESSVGTCNGNNGIFPRDNDTLITNDIDKDVIHTYSLTVTYNEASIDQSVDMDKSISARVNIFDEINTITELVAIGDTYQGNLPYQYQEVEYIQSTGTQYINTGFIPNNNTITKIKFSPLIDGSNSAIFGARVTNNNEYRVQVSMSSDESQQTIHRVFGNQIYGFTSDYYNWSKNVIYEMEFGKNVYINNNLTDTFADTTFTSSRSMYLFGFNGNGTPTTFTTSRVYYFKIYDNNVLVRDMIPCYRKSDNVIGMYDLVNNVFYKNEGNGAFLKGNNILPTPDNPLNIVSLGENGKNLFDINNCETGLILDDGTENASSYYTKSKFIKVSTPFTMSAKNTNIYNGVVRVALYDKDKNFISRPYFDLNSPAVITTANVEYVKLSFEGGTIFGMEGVFSNIQVEEGTQATEYRPYRYVDIVSSGKNLANISNLANARSAYGINAITNIDTSNGSFTINYRQFATRDFKLKDLAPNLEAGKTYYLFGNSSAEIKFIYLYGITGEAGTGQAWHYNTSKTITQAMIDGGIDIYGMNSAPYENTISNFMITEVNDNTYEAYQEPVTTTIDLVGHEPLRKIGNVSDYIDYKNKKIVRNIRKHTFTDANEFTLVNSYTNVAYARVSKNLDDINYNTIKTNNIISETHSVNNNSAYNSYSMINNFRSAGVTVYYFGFPFGTTIEQIRSAMIGTSYYYQLKDPIDEFIDFELPTTAGNTVTVKDDMLTANNVEVQMDS